MINTILFDLDGTLLPMDQEEFIKLYFKGIYVRFHEQYDFDKMSKGIWAGTKAMVANDGTYTNYETFWTLFSNFMGFNREDVEAEFLEFYNNEFSIAKGATTANPKILDCIHQLKEKGYTIIAATNPLFPQNATKNRLMWAGFEPSDFSLITTYEDCHFTKPNLSYYKEILEKIGKTPDECIMVGNDNQEDMCVEQIGIKGYLISDCLINRENAPINCTWTGSWDEFIDWTKTLPECK